MNDSCHVEVRQARAEDVSAVWELEEKLREDRPRAVAEGFLLSGGSDTPEKYAEFTRDGPFYVAEAGSQIIGFAFALGPASARMKKLKESRANFHLVDASLLDLPNLSWLAKVGVDPEWMRRGVGTALYRTLFASHPTYDFITTTVLEPVRNIPSEKLHEQFSFQRVGTLPLGDRGTLNGVLCNVFIRRSAA